MVSFIILNYNSSALTYKCVDSIYKYIKIPFEIIVVDNNSHSQDFSKLEGLRNRVDALVQSKYNGGFGAGNMLGANISRGQYLCFINSDVEFVEDCVTPLCLYLDENPNVGCITPQQCNKDGEPVDSFSHSNGIRHELFKDRLFEILMPQKFPDRKKILFPKEVNHINGCFMLFPEKKFWTIDGFDTNIFLYCEEYDLAMRLKKIGAICCFHPGYRFLHLQGASTTKNKAVIRELYISRIYVYRKYHNLLLSSIYRIIILVKILVKPHKWHILPVVLRGEALSLSMKHRKC